MPKQSLVPTPQERQAAQRAFEREREKMEEERRKRNKFRIAYFSTRSA